MLKNLILVSLAFIGAVPVVAQWVSGSCGPVGPRLFGQLSQPVLAQPAQPQGRCQWVKFPGRDDEIYLYCDGKLCKAYNYATKTYADWNGIGWVTQGPKQDPTVQPRKDDVARKEPAGQLKKDQGEMLNFGLNVDAIPEKGAQINGKPANQAQVYSILQSKLPDDAGKLRISLFGPRADRQRAENDLNGNPDLADLRNRFLFWSVDPDHHSTKDSKTGQPLFYTGGTPTIYLQTPTGQVLHRQDDYSGPEDWKQIRKRADQYDKQKDVDVRSGGRFTMEDVPPHVWVLGGLFIAVLLLRRSTR